MFREGGAGLSLTLHNGSVWNVSETSYLTKLTVDASSSVSGTMTVNGVQIPIAAGVYEGEIVVSPAAASGEASGEATSELASSVELKGVNVRDVFTLDVTLSFEDQGNGVKAYAIDFDGHHIEGVINMGAWVCSSEDSAEQDITDAVQAAYEAQTGAGGR